MQHIAPSRGWAAKQALAKAKMAAGISDRLAENIKDAADQLQADREAVAAAEAETARKRLETACPCPSCEGGTKVLSVDEAAFIASAVAFYKSHAYATDPDQIRIQRMRLANPDHVFIGERLVDPDLYRNDVNLGEMLAAQAPVIPAVETGTSEEAEALAEAVEPRKPARRHVPPPHLAD